MIGSNLVPFVDDVQFYELLIMLGFELFVAKD
jgi:hypothetical protein